MRLFAIFILLPQILYAQTFTQSKGYEETDYTTKGFRRKTQLIFDGKSLYNKVEETTWINQALPPNYGNAYVESHYVWGHYDSNQILKTDFHIQFIVSPLISTNYSITQWENPTNVGGFIPPKLPDTRIANTYTQTALDSYWNYCRTTWKLTNPSDREQYYSATYRVYPGGYPGTVGYTVVAHATNEIVFRYEDLIRISDSRPIKYLDPDGPAWGPYEFQIFPKWQVNFPIIGTPGTYYLPSIPTKKYILEYLEMDYFNSLNK